MVWRKTPTSTFYGYKHHLAITENRLIAGISVIHGGAPDGQELPELIGKAQENGIEVTEGNMAYVSDDNLEACGEEISLSARTNTAVEAPAKNGTTYLRYVFSKVKCRKCPLRKSCRVRRYCHA